MSADAPRIRILAVDDDPFVRKDRRKFLKLLVSHAQFAAFSG